MKAKLTELSKLLIHLHKSLINYEMDRQEKREQRKFSPHEMLNFSLNDPHFSWLRKISDLIVAIDTIVDDKERNEPEDFPFYVRETNALFFAEAASAEDFKSKIMQAISFNSEIVVQLSALRNFIKQNIT